MRTPRARLRGAWIRPSPSTECAAFRARCDGVRVSTGLVTPADLPRAAARQQSLAPAADASAARPAMTTNPSLAARLLQRMRAPIACGAFCLASLAAVAATPKSAPPPVAPQGAGVTVLVYHEVV